MRSFYHGTARPLLVGDTYVARSLKPGKQAGRMGLVLTAREEVEKLFERHRPKGMPSRQRSFFLAPSPEDVLRLGASSARHVYRVVPVGKVHRGDFEWLWRAGSLEMAWKRGMNASLVGGFVAYVPGSPKPSRAEQRAVVKSLVENYWKGKRSDAHRGWEWIAPRVRIVEEVWSGRG